MSFAGAESAGFSSNVTGLRASLLLSRVSNVLAEQGVPAYVVGGSVRDALLGRDTADIDIAIAADALEVAPRVAAALGGKYVMLDRVNRVGRVVLTDREAPSPGTRCELDFSTFEDSIEQDLARRDFTVDAMAIELRQVVDRPDLLRVASSSAVIPGLVDPFGGVADLGRRVIRAVAETAFEADAARLLRAVRLAAELGFSIDEKTEALIRRDSYLIASVSGERVREELLRLLAAPGAEHLLLYLCDLGLLVAVFPELLETIGVEQPREHFWSVFDHSLRTVAAVDFLLRCGIWEYAGGELLADVPWSAVLAEHFAQGVSHGSTRRLLLKLAALLHDIAKPRTKATDAAGRMRFLGHAGEGAVIAANILERLRFSTKEIRLVETMVKHHLRPSQMSQAELPSRRAIYRYFRDTGEAGIDTLFLNLADHLATRGPRLELTHWQEHVRVVEYVLARRFEEESIAHLPKLVDGHDLIESFGLSPGPRIGEILEAVREIQASGEMATRQEALSFVGQLLASCPSSKGENG